jgi:hypothetical protein
MNEMNISNARYIDANNTSILVTIDGQEMFVPLDPANRHYIAIQEWVAEGNTIAEAD